VHSVQRMIPLAFRKTTFLRLWGPVGFSRLFEGKIMKNCKNTTREFAPSDSWGKGSCCVFVFVNRTFNWKKGDEEWLQFM
jgi:hypothetical protein